MVALPHDGVDAEAGRELRDDNEANEDDNDTEWSEDEDQHSASADPLLASSSSPSRFTASADPALESTTDDRRASSPGRKLDSTDPPDFAWTASETFA